MAGEPADDPGHGVGRGDAVVGAEPPGPLDGGLGGRPPEAPAEGREGAAADPGGGLDQGGEGFALAQPQAGCYRQDPADDGVGRRGSSSAGCG
jgi:hypothetical protein